MLKTKNEKLQNISEKILKYWYIDRKTNKIKKLKSCSEKNNFVGFHLETSEVISKNGKSFKIYKSFKSANIVLHNIQIEKLRVKWQTCVDKSIDIHKEIIKLLDKLDKIRNERISNPQSLHDGVG